ncbi:hypothetical protein [Saccharopolyspora phatthalungensis]|uniref:Uncharacterized protein n=1 Tax=Saccharopolyspora phatthalungensis TaxID=664693 RepID=A0A840Q7A9_9PSEU|nr:hypothetical protein [Saccharopolyspora phatthalungensis]MBB5156564.1 hypothetical protein [Saccharopolyspora phatthalungensis]
MGSSEASPTIRAVLFGYGGVLTMPGRAAIQDLAADHARLAELVAAPDRPRGKEER